MNFKKPSFTLLEIVVVLLIMGFIYTIGISSFSKQTIQEDSYHFDLKAFLQDTLKVYDKKIELIVCDDFSVIRIDDDKNSDQKFTLPKDIEFYRYEEDGTIKEYFGTYVEDDYFKDVIFRYEIIPNKYTTKAIIKKDDKYHIQSNYFKDDMVFDEIYEAQEYLTNTDMKNSIVEADE